MAHIAIPGSIKLSGIEVNITRPKRQEMTRNISCPNKSFSISNLFTKIFMGHLIYFFDLLAILLHTK